MPCRAFVQAGASVAVVMSADARSWPHHTFGVSSFTAQTGTDNDARQVASNGIFGDGVRDRQ